MSRLTASPYWVQRVGVAVLLVDEVRLMLGLRDEAELAQAGWASPQLFQLIGRHPPTIAVLAGLVVGAAGLIAVGRRQLSAAVVALVSLHLLVESLLGPVATFPVNTFLVGLVLLGWTAGLALGKASVPAELKGAQRDHWSEAVASQLAVTAFAAGYVSAALAKLVRSGADWDHRSIWHLLTSSHRIDGVSSPIVEFLLGHPMLTAAMAGFALLAQASAVLMVWSQRGRWLSSAMLLLFHLGMWAVGGPTQHTTIFVVCCIVVPWPGMGDWLSRRLSRRFSWLPRVGGVRMRHTTEAEPDRRPGPETRQSPALRRVVMRSSAVSVLLLLVAGGAGLDRAYATRDSYALHIWQPFNQRRTHAHVRHPLSPTERAVVAPLTPGAELAGWTLWAVNGRDDGVIELAWRRGDRRLDTQMERPDPYTGARTVVVATPQRSGLPATPEVPDVTKLLKQLQVFATARPSKPKVQWPPR